MIVKVLVEPPMYILIFVPSCQMSPSLGEVGAVPERIRRDAALVVDAPTSSLAVPDVLPIINLAFVSSQYIALAAVVPTRIEPMT